MVVFEAWDGVMAEYNMAAGVFDFHIVYNGVKFGAKICVFGLVVVPFHQDLMPVELLKNRDSPALRTPKHIANDAVPCSLPPQM